MNYHLENAKRYLIYMYHLIKGRDSIKRIDYQFSRLNIDDKRMFVSGMAYNSQFDFQSSKVLNNKWGEWKLKKDEKYIQTLFEDGNRIGWEYTTPNKNRGVIGFPELFIGKSPFGGESTNEYFPKKIDDINILNATYDVSMYVEPKKYNLAFDLWVTKEGKNQTSDITHEIMIWEDRNVSMPAGKFMGEVNTSSGVYRMYHTYMDRTSENLGTPGWNFTAFVRKNRRRSGTVNLKEFIYLMLINDMIDENHFVSTVEFGNEIYNACGYTIVNEYNLDIK
jgi:hypothetical protein